MRGFLIILFLVALNLSTLTRVDSFAHKLSLSKYNVRSASNTLLMSANPSKPSPLMHIVARGMDLTESMNFRVEHKIGKVIEKLGQDVISTHVVLRVRKFPITESHTHTTKKDSQIAEVTVNCKGGSVIHASEQTDNLGASIDLVAHKLSNMIKKHHGKLHSKVRKDSLSTLEANALAAKELENEDDELENDVLSDLDPSYRGLAVESTIKLGKSFLSRPKTFDMPPTSVDDALTAFALVDHPFYVFRNKESNEINVLYRRKEGGVGLIMPQS